MRRVLRIALLHLLLILEYKGEALVWFLTVFINASFYLLFWRGALTGGKTIVGWTLTEASTYYLLLIAIASFLGAHIEYDVAVEDIQLGKLATYLTKPFSYLAQKFFVDAPWRVLQGAFGIGILGIGVFFWGRFFSFVKDPWLLAAAIVIGILAYLLSFTFKMIVGLSALWTTDFMGLQQLVTVTLLIFAGYLIPLEFLPGILQDIAFRLPFGYMVYFPILAFQGLIAPTRALSVIATQLVWLIILFFVYRLLWRIGVGRFTAVGR